MFWRTLDNFEKKLILIKSLYKHYGLEEKASADAFDEIILKRRELHYFQSHLSDKCLIRDEMAT